MFSIFKDQLLHLLHFSLQIKIVDFHPCTMTVFNIAKVVPLLLRQTRLFCLIWITPNYRPFLVSYSYQTKCFKHTVPKKA